MNTVNSDIILFNVCLFFILYRREICIFEYNPCLVWAEHSRNCLEPRSVMTYEFCKKKKLTNRRTAGQFYLH